MYVKALVLEDSCSLFFISCIKAPIRKGDPTFCASICQALKVSFLLTFIVLVFG